MVRAALSSVLLASLSVAASLTAGPLTVHPLHDGWSFRQVGRETWYPAAVPGSVHLDLHRNELIADPFHRDNEAHLQWIGKVGWEYRTELAVPPAVLARRHVELVFDGLDTYARVFLNGEEVLAADNMYRRWRVDVRRLLNAERNVLRVEFRSPILEALPSMGRTGYELPAVNDTGEKTSPYTRKAPYQFGWDWGPRFVTCGIWKPVRLEAWDEARLVDVAVRTLALTDEAARLRVEAEVLGDPAAGTAGARLSVEVDPAGPGASVSREVTLLPGVQAYELDVEIARPRRWWPAGYGDQPLYDVKTRLLMAGRPADESSTRIGLRTIELRREKDEWGRSFEFVVNGVPVFAKGANWIPADSFPTRVDRRRYETLLRSARDANMNMLRVWGGGLYEGDEFYDVADELGLLIWQDFHFSCSLYPADEAFLANVAAEAEQAVRRLRNRASLALWCGNNEIEAAWWSWGWKERLPGWLWDDYQKLFHEVLPGVCARHDPTRAYWPSSPSANREAAPGDSAIGDMHYWGVWHGKEPFARYEDVATRFMSEYGFQSFPEMKTLRSFAEPRDLALESPVMLAHQKNARGNALIRDYMLDEYPPPKDFDAFVYLSQVQQAEGIKIGAEALRRRRPRTMGSLYWQLNDCWPVASWSSLDYFGRWKALHHYARRFYAPLLVSLTAEDADVSVWVVSDRTAPAPATLLARLLDVSGKVLWEKREELVVTPLSSTRVWSVPRTELLGGRDPATVFLWAELRIAGEVASANRRFFVPAKAAALPRPNVEVEVAASAQGLRIRLKSDVLARSVRLSYEPDDGSFSDNYFDLLPGAPVEVLYRPEGDVTVEALRQGLSVTTLVDAFASTAGGGVSLQGENQ